MTEMSRLHWIRRAGMGFALPLALIAGCGQAHQGDVMVAVATNFLDTAKVLEAEFEADTGLGVALSSGSTGQLYSQIENGAPFDIFLAADTDRPRRLVDAGHHGARLRADAHQPVLFQQLKGLADGRQADPVFGRKVCPAEHRVGRKIEVQDPRPEAFVDRFRGRPGGALGQQALGRGAMDHNGRPAKTEAIG